ncbi:MAG: lysophospholipase L1-like esterase [Planctomycetota bacterium]|jgi:lysophospholipase L1-like esterase
MTTYLKAENQRRVPRVYSVLPPTQYGEPMHHLQRAVFLISLILSGCQGTSQSLEIPAYENPTRWAKQVKEFTDQDRLTPVAKGSVLFLGSSSIRLWDSLATDMAPTPVINRGFGGSKLFDAIYYSERLVSVHQPSVVVVFSGSNDIAGDNAKSADEVRDLFRQLVERLRLADHDLTIGYIAITPTLAREDHLATVREANRLIKIDCEADSKLEFVDPSVDLNDADGRPDPQWFKVDRLHLNDRGYEVWTEHIRPLVQKLYTREQLRDD